VYGALEAAANLAELFADGERVKTFQRAAGEVRVGMEKYLWHDGVGRFVRMLTPNPDDPAVYTPDLTMDSALMAVWAFGAFAPDDPRAVATMEQVIGRLTCRTALGGIARYENDYYFRRSDDIERIPGNPWIICTLWAAQWYIARAKTRKDCKPGLDLLLWAAQRAMESGLLPEQIHPETGEPLSVAPLTWSHAEFIETTLNYLEKTATLPD
jgi:GH15 family glucan-1,4-alpha-glucosidase